MKYRNHYFSIGLLIYAILAVSSIDSCRRDKPMATLEFVGRVENISADGSPTPLNNRLVIAYCNGREVSRSISALGKYEGIDNVPDDGLFVIYVPNDYEITQKEIGFSGTGTNSVVGNLTDFQLGNSMFLNWGLLPEGAVRRQGIDSRKNLEYAIHVVPNETTYLPEALLSETNSTFLSDENKIVVVAKDGGTPVDVQDVVFSDKEEEVKVKELEFPFNNCRGSSPINQRYYKTEAYLHETRFSTEVSAKLRVPMLWLAGIDLSGQIKSKYGFLQREMGQETIEYNFKVPAKKNITYVVSWYEIWKSGTAKVKTNEGVVEIPFSVKTRMRYNVDSKRGSCR